MKNEHGIECPIPLQYWPEWAQYVVTGSEGGIFAFSHEPIYHHNNECWMLSLQHANEARKGQYMGCTLKTVVPYYHIWKRPE